MESFIGKLGGLEIPGIVRLPDGTAAPWKEVLRRTSADIEEAMVALGGKGRMVFLWDEVPYLLENIAKKEGAAVAMEVLDTLRALGQDHDHIRLLLTGSIGLHHILGSLKKEGYNGSPLNRMELVQSGPLEAADGLALASSLLTGNFLAGTDLESCAAAVASSVGHVPFYIHKLISRLPKTGPPTPESIAARLDREITSDHNDWDLRHYRDRLKPCYGPGEKLALLILDAVATGGTLSFEEIRRRVNAQEAVDDESLRDLLRLLCMDHYLFRDAETYRFYLSLIRLWWRLSRNL